MHQLSKVDVNFEKVTFSKLISHFRKLISNLQSENQLLKVEITLSKVELNIEQLTCSKLETLLERLYEIYEVERNFEKLLF